MPLYEYKCLKCGRHTEKIESLSGPYLSKCPHCGGKIERLLAAPAIQFKGAGWYVTDYAGKSKDADSKEEKPVGETKDGATKDRDSPAKDSPAKETASKESKEKKPAKKK